MGFPRSPWGLLSPFLTLHLLRLGSAELRVVGPRQHLLATVGQDVVLPCHLSPRMDARSLEIGWIRHLVSETVHLYRNGEDLYGEQMEEYAGRTELARDGLSSGSLDLRISGLTPSDDGLYVCTVRDAGTYAEVMVEVEVAALGSVPLLSLEAYEDGGIRVVCRSAGWYPPPQLLWKDGSGQHPPSASLKRSRDERGLYEIQDVIVVSGKGDRNVSCVVRNSRLEQELSLHVSGKRDAALALMLLLLLSPADVVTLDPNTAHSELVLLEDLRRVRCGPTWQNLPYTPQRFSYWRCVLGQERFREGRHCWEVEVKGEVGGDSWWGVGVAKESMERKGIMDLKPEEGIWAVGRYKGQFMALTSPRTVLSNSPLPRRIWVCLDCTRGLVTFLNADTGGEIFTFPPGSFHRETLRPWFWVETWETQLCLRGSTP
ncbi:PREDICTED: butyrophilin subfamily 3 member A3-like [Calidris pugnax]|uniref:butyrophilin subfamily 3 member A3-like n=1 Tax=Calidris pugnax TaxID=198806 RepID=UPI00071DC128|nr:PREDICTED: butyrophilin subfamily 3 member A3-like [Calidris pugnax]